MAPTLGLSLVAAAVSTELRTTPEGPQVGTSTQPSGARIDLVPNAPLSRARDHATLPLAIVTVMGACIGGERQRAACGIRQEIKRRTWTIVKGVWSARPLGRGRNGRRSYGRT